MDKLNKPKIEAVIGSNDEYLVAELYQKVEQLSLPAKAALAQHLISTNELKVVVSNCATVGNAIQAMDRKQLGNVLESIAEQVRQLTQN